MTATMTNGRPRKQLSDQLERLDEQLQRHDAILDALSEGLNGAVADATKEGTKEAVTAAVIELLTNGDLRAALHRASAPEGEAKVSGWERLKGRVRQATEKVKAVATVVATAIVARVTGAVAAARRLLTRVRQSVRARVAVQVLLAVTALGVGVRYYAVRQFTMAVGWVKFVAQAIGDKVSGWVHVILPAQLT
jgi:cell division septum initiation protein DivIVA